MEFKRKDKLSISESCKLLKLDIQAVKKGVASLSSVADIEAFLADLRKDNPISTESDKQIIKHLAKCLYEDLQAFRTSTVSNDQSGYLNNNQDGLWGEEATIVAENQAAVEEEKKFYNKHKGTVKGLNWYLRKYPSGIYAAAAKREIERIKKGRKLVKWTVVLGLLTVLIMWGLLSYHPVTYLTPVENIDIGKRGGKISCLISTDALDENMKFNIAERWVRIETEKEGRECVLVVDSNFTDKRDATVTVYAFSTMFGFELSRKEMSFNISQETGLASRLRVSENEINFGKWGGNKQIYASTDGMELDVSSQGDIDYSLKRTDDGNDFKYIISISAQKNDYDKKDGKIKIKSGKFEKNVIITQESGLAQKFDVSQESFNIPETTQENLYYELNIYTDGTSWSYDEYDCGWIHFDKKENSLRLFVENNKGGNVRTGTINLTSNNGHKVSVQVKQYGNPTEFGPEMSSISFGTSGDYEYVRIKNNSNYPLRVSDDCGWISTENRSKNEIKISCGSNSGEPRRGTVTICCGNKETSITVKQKGWKECSSCDGDGTKPCPNTFSYYDVYGFHRQQALGAWGFEIINCPTCGGNGNISCKSCGGNGKIESSY